MFPLTLSQKDIYFDQLHYAENPLYNIGGYIRFKNIDVNKIKLAHAKIVTHHDAFGIRIVSDKSGVQQYISEARTQDLPLIDFSASADANAIATEWLKVLFETPISIENSELFRAYLLKIDADCFWYVGLSHHLAMDGYGFANWAEALSAHYSDRDYTGDSSGGSWIKISESDEKYISSEKYTRDKQYWLEYISNIPDKIFSAYYINHFEAHNYIPSQRYSRSLPDELCESVELQAKNSGVGVAQIFLSALTAFFSLAHGQKSLLIGIPVHNRNNFQQKKMLGVFASLSPLLLTVDHNSNLNDLIKSVSSQLKSNYRHQKFPVSHLSSELKLSGNQKNIYEIVFNFLGKESNAKFDGEVSDLVYLNNNFEKIPLNITFYYGETGKANIFFDFNYAYFCEAEISLMATRFEKFISEIILNNDSPLGSLSILPDNERDHLLYELNNYRSDPITTESIISLFDSQVKKIPNMPAVAFADMRISYQDLDKSANRLARYLVANGFTAGTIVSLCFDRSVDMIVAIMAILKSGAAYLPIDANYPLERIQYMLDDSQSACLLTQSHLLDKLVFTSNISTIAIDNADFHDQLLQYEETMLPLCNSIKPQQLAYVIYTSGSTGKPKGVCCTHSAVINLLGDFQARRKLDQGDNCSLWTSISFDVSVYEIFSALCYGACLHVIEEDIRTNNSRLFSFLERSEITSAFLPAYCLEELAQALSESRYSLSLKRLLVGVEPIAKSTLLTILSNIDGLRLINGYGPTESTVCCTLYDVFPEENKAIIGATSIGKPVVNHKVYILDENQNLCPKGIIGELYVGGAGLATGYLHRPELTAEKFIADPFSNKGQNDRIYRTGDLVRYQADGNIEYIGRSDDQIKIRGYRVEMGEIEAQLVCCSEVSSCLVMAKTDDRKRNYLAAYIVTTQPTHNSHTLRDKLKSELNKRLPDYMIPSYFIFISQWPLTPNGKIDKPRLPEPEIGSNSSQYIPPSNDIEMKLVNAWAEVLKISQDKISVDANFFELGGDSILSIQVVSKAAQIGLHFTVKDLFSYGSINQLARYVKTESLLCIDQGAVVGEMPLLPVQRRFFCDNKDMSHFNQSIMLVTPADFDENFLPKMVETLLKHHDSLRLIFSREESHWRASFQEASELFINNSYTTEYLDDFVAENVTTFASEMQKTLSVEEGRLFKVVFIRPKASEPPEGRLLLVIHHLVIDGVSWRILLEDIQDLYKLWKSKASFRLPLKTSSYKDWAQFLEQYASSDTLQNECDYWAKTLNHSAEYLWEAQINHLPNGMHGTGVATLRIDESISSQFLNNCNQAYYTKTSELLLASFALAAANWYGKAELQLRVDMESHGREMLNDAFDFGRTVGWFTSIFPVNIEVNVKEQLDQIICRIKEQCREAPCNGIGFSILKELTGTRELSSQPKREILFNYLGNFDQLLEEDSYFRLAPENVGETVSPARQVWYPMAINCMIINRQLNIEISFDKSFYNNDAIQLLTEHFSTALTEVVTHCRSITEPRHTPSDFPLAKISIEQLNQWQAEMPLENVYPATGMQQGLLFQSMFNPGSYISQLSLAFSSLHVGNFKNAWEILVSRHEILRTSFVGLEAETIHQRVHANVNLAWHEEDIKYLSVDQQKCRLQQYLDSDRAQGFKPNVAVMMRLSLFRLTESKYQFIWSHHHALLDGWSIPLIWKELIDVYHSLCDSGRAVTIAPQAARYSSYIEWLSTRDNARAQEYWLDQVASLQSPTPLPLQKYAVPKVDAHLYTTRTISFTEGETTDLLAFVQSSKTTLNILLQAAWALMLSRYSGEKTVTFGAVNSGRPAELPGVEQMLGLFINTLPVVVVIDQELSVRDWLNDLHSRQVERDAFGYLALSDIQRLNKSGALFNSSIVFENYPIDESIKGLAAEAGIVVDELEFLEESNFDLSLVAHLNPLLSIDVEINETRFIDGALDLISQEYREVVLLLSKSGSSMLCSLSSLHESQKKTIIAKLNNNNVYSVCERSLIELFSEQAERTPDHIAISVNGDALSYAELEDRSRKLAVYLHNYGVVEGSTVGVCLERSTDLLVAIFATFKLGATYVPLDASYPENCIHHMITDAQLQYVICHKNFYSFFSENVYLKHTIVLDTINIYEDSKNTSNVLPNLNNFTCPAYVIYTSGSTGKPKGVVVSQRALSYHIQDVVQKFDFNISDRVLQMASYSFDTFMEQTFSGLISGASIYILSDNLISASEFFDITNRLKITICDLMPAFFGQLLEPSYLSHWKASTLTRIVVGGDTLTQDTVKKWMNINHFDSCQLFNAYGPTEGVITTTIRKIDASDVETVCIGQVFGHRKILVMNEQLQLCPIGGVGQLFIGGDCLATGYLNNSELTTKQFITIGNERYYKTGDLVRSFQNGNLEFVGRLDEQVKIRGFRIELGEIQARLSECQGIESSLIKVVDGDDGSRYLVAYAIKSKTKEPVDEFVAQLRESLQRSLPAYMLPAFFVFIDSWPLTPNGKIDKRALPKPELTISHDCVKAEGQTETKLQEIWSHLLNISPAHLGVLSNFFELGGHSLLAMRLVAEIRDHWNKEISIRQVFDTPTIRSLAKSIDAAHPNLSQGNIQPVDRDKKELPLSFAQQRLWFIDQINQSSAEYNMPIALELVGSLDISALNFSFTEIIKRHESLRTCFKVDEKGQVYQVVQSVRNFHITQLPKIDFEDHSNEVATKIEKLASDEACYPFDLEKDLMLRATLLPLSINKHLLLVTMHHIASDGWSISILIDEFITLYSAYIKGQDASLPELKIQYADYASWQRTNLQGKYLEAHLSYWVKRLDTAPIVHSLPLDHPRPAAQQFNGRIYSSVAPQSAFDQLNKFCKSSGLTMFMGLHAAFSVLLARLSNTTDIVVGSPVANREQPEVAGLIGFFVNTLALRSNLSNNPSFIELAKQSKETLLGAYAHQQVPFEHLLECLQIERSLSHSPLFQVMLAFQEESAIKFELPNLLVKESRFSSTRVAKFDLTLMVSERNNGLNFEWEYNTELFEPDTIARMSALFNQLLLSLLHEPEKCVFEIPILPPDVIRQIDVQSSGDSTDFARDLCIHEHFENQVNRQPHAIAIIIGDQQLSYQQLNKRVNRLARFLVEKRGVRADSLVGICFDRSIDMIVGIMSILKAGGAYVPLDPEYPDLRLLHMIESAGLKTVLTYSHILDRVPIDNELTICLDDEHFVSSLNSYSDTNLDCRERVIKDKDLAYVIFTSGSTGAPKGVMVERRGVRNLLNWYTRVHAFGSNDAFFLISSISFDLTQKNIFAPLITGGRIVISNQNYFDPDVATREIETHAVSILNCSPSMFYPLLAATAASNFQALSYLRFVFLGGEPINNKLVSPWLSHDLCKAQLINTYGPTECSDVSTSCHFSGVGHLSNDIGSSIDNVAVYALDEFLNHVPTNTVGELYIDGDGVGRGYLNQPELTREKFIQNPFFHGEKNGKSKYLYKTGDLVRRLPSGHMEFIGRVDHQIKIRGLRIELGEIEKWLLQYTAIKEAIASVFRTDDENDCLIAHITTHASTKWNEDGEKISQLRENFTNDVRDFLKKYLPSHMVPSIFMLLESMPLSPNGKIDRSTLAKQKVIIPRYVSALESNTEKLLAEIWSDLLGCGIENIGTASNFFNLGGHSLLVIRLVAEIRTKLQKKLSVREVFEGQTIRELARIIDNADALDSQNSIIKVERGTEPLHLSFSQQRLLIIDRVNGKSAEYNMPVALSVYGKLDLSLAEKAITQIIKRHEILRTIYSEVEDNFVQIVRDPELFKIQIYDMTSFDRGLKNKEIKSILQAERLKAFDLSTDLMIRSCYIMTSNEKNNEEGILFFNTHHIAADGWSINILIQEFMAQYTWAMNGETDKAPALKIQYADYAGWQRRYLDQELLDVQYQYWKTQLEGLPVTHSLPLSKTRPTIKKYDGDIVRSTLNRDVCEKLDVFARAHQLTRFMLLHGVLSLILSRHSNSHDIVLGTPVANRLHSELSPLIGFFVNTLVLRVNTNDDDLDNFFNHVRTVNLEAQSNQEIPFEVIVERSNVKRSPQHTPMFQIMLSMNTNESLDLSLPGLQINVLDDDDHVARFDLEIVIQSHGEELSIDWVFDQSIFDKNYIHILSNHFDNLLTNMIKSESKRISSLNMLSPSEMHTFLHEVNNTIDETVPKTLVHRLFENQVCQTPDHIAVIFESQQLTYRQLNSKANQLAHYLMSSGVETQEIVGICMERSMDMVIAIWAILKAGAAYLPLNPELPENRLNFMIEDASVRIVLSNNLTAKNFNLNSKLVCLNDSEVSTELATYSIENLDIFNITPENLAYVIYTSGSTGKPKGVMVEHFALVNRIDWMHKEYGSDSSDTVLQKTPFSFDVSVWEFVWPMLSGARLLLARPDGHKDPGYMCEIIREHNVTKLHFVPSMLGIMLVSGSLGTCRSIKQVFCSGEALAPFHVEEFHSQCSFAQLHNLYGPTEAAIDVSYWSCENFNQRKHSNVPIGKPIQNTQLYVLDKHLSIVPSNAIGELYIGGVGLAREYLNLPELTDEKFIPNPFYDHTSFASSSRLYKTGDFARWIVKDEQQPFLEYLGRIDQQVKIRGFRIELGEIENILLAHEEIKDAAVVAHPDHEGGSQLVGYFSTKIDVDWNKEAEGRTAIWLELLERIKAYLHSELPDYMIPSSLLVLSEMPLSSNGKVDRKALPQPNQTFRENYVAPESNTEKTIVSIWAKLLNFDADKIGLQSNFFELGGHSLLVIKLVSEIELAFEFNLSAYDIFEHQTVKKLSLHLDYLNAISGKQHDPHSDTEVYDW